MGAFGRGFYPNDAWTVSRLLKEPRRLARAAGRGRSGVACRVSVASRAIGAIGYFDAVLSEPDEAGSDLQNA
jgi:hypothetical protein